MILITIFVIVVFSVIWSAWWIRIKPLILQNFLYGIVNEQRNIREFNDHFQPTTREILPIPKLQSKKPVIDTLKTDTINTSMFDTTYYYYLWDMYVQEYGMDEVDSLTIDSMIKADMIRSAMETNSNSNQDNTSFTIKKDELLYVTSLKPVAHNPLKFSEEDSLEFAELQDYTYTLEFWKSPLNYMGHKTTGNMIIVYGINEFDDITVRFLSGNNLALRIDSKLFAIKNDGLFYTFKETQIK
jgi:hypothetical protein